MLSHNAYELSVQLDAHGMGAERELANEMHRLANEIARSMRARTPMWRSGLVQSIKPTQDGPLTWEIRPGVEYGLYREKGQKPGKHLPKFGTPAAHGLTEWLRDKFRQSANAGPNPYARARKGSKRFNAMESALRDRYNALSWHVFHKGLRAQPFVEPTYREYEKTAPQRMADAVQRAVARANGAGGQGGGVA